MVPKYVENPNKKQWFRLGDVFFKGGKGLSHV